MDAVSIEDREERVATIDARLADIDEEYANTLMPEDVRDEWNRLNGERDEHVATVAEVKRRKSRLADIVANRPQATERPTVETAAFVQRRSDEQIHDIVRHRAESRSEEDFRQRLHDNARRALEKARFGSVRNVAREDAQTTVDRLLDAVDDEHGTLAKRILVTGSAEYERWFWAKVRGRGDVPMPRNAMELGTDAQGGFAVPFQLDPTVILTSDGSINPLRQISRVEQVVGKEWQGVTSAGITVTRSAEAAEAADGSPTLAQPVVRPTRVLGFVPFSMELDQDWGQLRGEITRLLQDAKDTEEATSFVTGNGTDPNPEGVVAGLAAGSVINVTGGGGFATTQATLYAAEEALPPRFRPRARWLANKAIYNEIRSIDTTGGADLWVRLAAGQPAEVIGYPAHEASAMTSDSATTGNRYLLFGDFATGFLIVDRIGMNVELVQHLFGATNRFPTGQRGIVAIWRNSSLVLVDNAFRALAAAI
jgi:HK97 family phage major capsid protein